MTRLAPRAFPLAALTLALAGCGGNENTLAPKGGPEHAITHLWWWTMTGAWIGFAVVCVLLFLGWLRRNRTELPFGGDDERARRWSWAWDRRADRRRSRLLFVWSDVFVAALDRGARPRARPADGRA